MSKGIELAKKLLALKNSSTHESEKAKAEKLLNNILHKYGLSMSNIESDEERDFLFIINAVFPTLFWQCVVNVIGTKVKVYQERNKVWLSCSEVNAIEIKEKYQFYISVYKKELKVFRNAFIQKHRIFSIDGSGKTQTISQEEAAKLANLMKGMEDVSYNKALNG